MRLRDFRKEMFVSVASLSLAACGGGGGGGFVSSPGSVPPPPPTCTPSPCPPPSPPPPPTHNIGLKSADPFATFSAYKDAGGNLVGGQGGVQIAYSAATDTYSVTLPGFQQGNLVTTGASGSFDGTGWIHISATDNDVTAGSSTDLQNVKVLLDYAPQADLKYTSFGSWYVPGVASVGVFAYGIPTAVGDVPAVGSATYDGKIRGFTNDSLDVFGTIQLQFDFGAGTLAGHMNPEVAPVWDAISLGTYTFRDTVYSSGSTTFSGAFTLPGTLTGPSSFQGRFTGPGAAELMGGFTAPYALPGSSTQGTMTGVFGGRRP